MAEVSQEDLALADQLAVRTLVNFRRRDGLTCFAHDENRVRAERYMRETFAEIVAPAFAELRSKG